MNYFGIQNLKALLSSLLLITIGFACKGREGVEVSEPKRDQRVLNLGSDRSNNSNETQDASMQLNASYSEPTVFLGYLPGESDQQREERIAQERQKAAEANQAYYNDYQNY